MRATKGPRDIAHQVRALRTARGLTQAALADRSGLSLDAVSRIELARRQPNLGTVTSLARALGVDPAALMPGPRSRPHAFSRSVLRLATFLERQPPEVVLAVEGSARAIARAFTRRNSLRHRRVGGG